MNHTGKTLQVIACILLLSIALIAVLLQCSPTQITGSETGNPGIISSAALVKMPSSLTGGARRTGNDSAENIYGFIREQNSFVNQLVNGNVFSVKWILDSLVAPLPWDYIKQMVSYKDTSADSVYFEATYSNTDTLKKFTVVIASLKAKNRFQIKAVFNGDGANPKGWVYYFIGKPEQVYVDSQKIRVDFSKQGTQRSIDVTIVQQIDTLKATAQQKKEFARSFKYSLFQENEIIHLSASTCFPYLDSLLKGTVGYTYTYTAVADTVQNRAVVNLGVPPMACKVNDAATIFDTYGIANIYGNAFVYYYVPGMAEMQKRIVVTSYKDTLRIDSILIKIATGDTAFLRPSSEIQSMTITDLKNFLLINNSCNPDTFSQLLWILKLDQPVYFNPLGYAGNGAKIPPGFETIAAITCNRPIFKPYEVSILTITNSY